MNPRELLPDYVLGLLSLEEKVLVEKYLADSSTARAELQALQQTFIKLSENAPSALPKTSYQDLQRRLRTAKQTPTKPTPPIKTTKPLWHKELREWRNYAIAASLALAVLGWSWSWNTQQEAKRIATENETLNEWLAYGDLTMSPLKDEGNNAIGTVLVSPRNYALFILNTPPPAGKSYQAWGRVNGTVTSLAVAENRLIPVNCKGFERIGVSLEPAGGSPQPTQPLGGIPLEYR
jgi:anti-sigma-K factor RskA